MKRKAILISTLLICFTLGACKPKGETESKSPFTPLPSSASSSIQPSSETAQTVKIAVIKEADSLNIREDASKDGKIVGTAKTDDKFRLLIAEPRDGWYRIEFKGESAYVFSEYVDVKEISAEEAEKLDETNAETTSPQSNASTENVSGTSSSETSQEIENEDGEA